MTVSSASEGKVVPDSSALDRLNNPVLHALLDIIDNSRELQVGEIVNPPQIIVVGDQSSGKSSVLEAISRVPFPVKSRLCTLFATELILRRGSEFKGDVRIQYGNTSSMFGRPERSIQPFRKTNFNINDLPDIVNEAKEHMGIGVGTSKVFSEDILVVEVTSPDIYPMTLVDLPGFFHSIEMSKQKVVEQLANKYMRQSNSIILAVVSANCCFKTQMVLHMSEKHDPRRERTLGIITKPDLLPKGSADEEETLQLAKNQETAIKLILGWHVLRNRDEGEQTTGADERDAQEERFFQSSPWSTIPPTDRGIKSLRKKLSKVLLEHIRKSLPGPVQEIEDALKPRSEELERLGKPRPSPNDIRSNRIDAAGSFQRLGVASEALDTTTDHICHYIPFPKNKRFVGRDSTLDALKQMLFTRKECRKVALVGLGGIGKTQVALQLAYWTKDHRPEYSIFWVPAMSAASFEQAYVEMARKLPIQKDSEDEDPKESVRRYLSSEAAGSWLLVVDNMEDMDLLAGSPEVPICISDCLPERDGGLTLFTTRSREVAVAVAGSDILELHEMDLQEAKTFLERSLIRKNLLSDNAAARELLDELTRLPLAISQAAAYLNRNQVSIVEYLGLLRGTEKDRVNLMSREFHDSTRYKGSQNAVATTWLVSFDRIRKSDNAAAILLSFMSCIDPKAIPRSILPDLESEEQMMHAIGTLCGYNFVVRREDDNMFDMHSLVYLATRIWVQREGLAVQTTRDVIRHLKNILPSDDYTNRNLWREYLPHAFRVLYENERVDTEERYELCFWVGQHLQANGRIKDAIRCLEDCYRWRESHFLEGHPDRLASQHALAKAYRADGQIKQAVKLLEYVVAVREGTLAENHPDRLASQLELAGAYQVDGQVKKADELFERITKFGYLDDEANSCDDTDLESLFSSRSSLTSQTHVSLNEQQLDGTILLTDFLFRNEDLNELYNLASTKVTASKLRIHLRGFFQRYGKDLEQEATNETEKLAAWFVRKYAGYVANEIKEALQKEKALKRPGITLPLEPTEINKQSVGRWLASTSEDERHQKLGTRETARPQFHPEVTEASRREDDEDSYGDSGGEEEEPRSGTDDLRTSYQVLGEVKQFLISAEAFQTLKNALRKWLKSSETNDAKATPENADENCQEPLAVKVDFTNATTEFPRTLPVLIDSILDILPFPISEPPIPPGQTRIRWKCSCGQALFDDFVEVEPGALQALQTRLQELNGTERADQEDYHSLQNRVKIIRERLSALGTRINRGVKQIGITIDRRNSALPLHRLNTEPQHGPASDQKILHLLLCIDKGEFWTRLYQERLQCIGEDRELFQFLREQYYKHRNLMSWFTLRGVKTVSLARFKVDTNSFAGVHSHKQVCMSECVCIPPLEKIDSKEYQCQPAPKVQPNYFPVIGSRELTHYFLKPHAFNVPQRIIFNQLPKRACGQLASSPDEAQLGWGIHFNEGWHWRTIYFVTVVFLTIGSLLFGITWSIKKSDIQGAFAITASWMALAPILLGYIAVRDVS